MLHHSLAPGNAHAITLQRQIYLLPKPLCSGSNTESDLSNTLKLIILTILTSGKGNSVEGQTKRKKMKHQS